jgi:putative ABC transport system permease protein
VIVQQVLPAVLKDLLPLETSFRISWQAIGQGVGTGMIISMLFALLPLLTIRKISPLYTLRLSVEPAAVVWDPLKAVVYAAILGFIIVFSFFRMQSWGKATVFALSLLGAFLLLAGAARLLMIVVRRLFPERWNYLWRQGFANLFRPNNQTLILVVTIGLGTTFIGTLYFVQQLLIERVTISASANQGNMVLFDIQHDQRDAIAGLARQHHLPVLQEIPIVTMRIKEIKGKTEEESPLARDSAGGAPRRAFDMEMRVTYRDSLTASETLVAGKIWKAVRSSRDTIYISVDEDYARRFLHARVGDPIVFDVQGVPITTVIGSLRKVEWRMRINFPVVFPSGVLEQAPQFDVLITQVPSPEASARFQQAVVRGYPNVSVIDLGLILSVLEEILGKIGFVIRFMAAFSMLTGVVVLIASVLISKYQRIQESVLLRTLGASRRQVLLITLLEYFFLGGLAAVTGIGLSLAFTGVMARWVFESPFAPHLWPVLLLFISVSGLTILIGLYNSRGVLNKPPLEILRREG